MRKYLTGLVLCLVSVAVVCAAILFGLYRASQQVPDFYQRALVSTAVQESGERFERQALALHNQVQHPGHWEARFTEDEINAWLAGVLPEKFPQALASGISDPRVAIEGDTLRLAVRYERGSTSTIVSLAARAHLTDEPNEIAVEIRDVRAGSLPVPLARFLEEIKLNAAQAGLPLRWTEAAGQPVALVRLPLTAKGSGRRRQMERLQLEDRALVVGGRTEELPDANSLAEAQSLAGSDNQGSDDQASGEVASPAASDIRHR
jgi:hypothetical protein